MVAEVVCRHNDIFLVPLLIITAGRDDLPEKGK
jgi:hypothetical protein